MDKNRLHELITKKISGVITLAEMRELNNHFSSNWQDRQLFDLFNNIMQGRFEVNTEHDDENLQKRLAHIKEAIREDNAAKPAGKNKIPVYTRWLRRAAAVLIISLGIAAFYYTSHKKDNQAISKNIMSTKPGSKSMITLSDGTKVWLNADSKLTYEKSYGEKTRSVDLTGEAYFDVVKDADHPFIVHTKAMDIKVLGTAFNVRAYDNEVNTQATLLRGKIEVSLRNKNDEKIILKPNEKIIVKNIEFPNSSASVSRSRNAPEMSVINIQTKNTADSTANEIQWTKNRLVFDQTDFSEIIQELERWYGVKIVVKDSSVLERRLSGIFENESLQEVLESFRLAAGFKYKLSDNTLTLYK